MQDKNLKNHGLMHLNTLPCSQPDDKYWMRHAISLAERAPAAGEVPVGALVVVNHQPIGEGWNQPITCHDPTAHAEILALRKAGEHQKNYRLVDGTLYVTLEPCIMCVGAIIHSRLRALVYGAPDPKKGAITLLTKMMNARVERINIRSGIMAEDCSKILLDFFQQRRKAQKERAFKKK